MELNLIFVKNRSQTVNKLINTCVRYLEMLFKAIVKIQQSDCLLAV